MARVFVWEPRMLLLDEPIMEINIEKREEMAHFLDWIKKGIGSLKQVSLCSLRINRKSPNAPIAECKTA